MRWNSEVQQYSDDGDKKIMTVSDDAQILMIMITGMIMMIE